MKVQALKIELLNHLFYHTEVSNGSVTGAFIGDMALTYALRKAIVPNSSIYEHRLQPNYQEIKDWGFYISVAKPVKAVPLKHNKGISKLKETQKPRRTGSYTRNTLFNTDGFYDISSIEKSGKSPFKNLIHTQGLAIGSEFTALLVSEKEITLPNTLRVGNQKETLLKIETVDIEATDNDFWLNLFTLKAVFGKLEEAVDLLQENEKMNFQYILESYQLMKHFSAEDVKKVFT